MVTYQVVLTSLFQKGKVLGFNFNFEMLRILLKLIISSFSGNLMLTVKVIMLRHRQSLR